MADEHSPNIYNFITHQFPSEHMLVEVVLDLFVCNVDAKLLKGVPLEVLEAEDIQNTNLKHLLPAEKRVNIGSKLP